MPTIQNEILEEVQSWLAHIQQEVSTLKDLLAAEERDGIETANLVVDDDAAIKGGGLQVAGDMKADDAVSAANISALAAMFSQQLKDDASFRRSVTGAQGDRGPQGERGAQGQRGDAGETGAPGARGDKGPKGNSGRDRGVQHRYIGGRCSYCGEPAPPCPCCGKPKHIGACKDAHGHEYFCDITER